MHGKGLEGPASQERGHVRERETPAEHQEEITQLLALSIRQWMIDCFVKNNISGRFIMNSNCSSRTFLAGKCFIESQKSFEVFTIKTRELKTNSFLFKIHWYYMRWHSRIVYRPDMTKPHLMFVDCFETHFIYFFHFKIVDKPTNNKKQLHAIQTIYLKKSNWKSPAMTAVVPQNKSTTERKFKWKTCREGFVIIWNPTTKIKTKESFTLLNSQGSVSNLWLRLNP